MALGLSLDKIMKKVGKTKNKEGRQSLRLWWKRYKEWVGKPENVIFKQNIWYRETGIIGSYISFCYQNVISTW